MLNSITWQEYWTTLALLSGGYYLVIYLLYYRSDFKIEFAKRMVKEYPSTSLAVKSLLKEQNQSSISEESNEFQTPTAGDEQVVYACMDELNAYFGQSKKIKCAKEEFIYAMQKILSKYASLKSSEFKEAVSKLIISEAAHNRSIHLSEADVIHVWLEK